MPDPVSLYEGFESISSKYPDRPAVICGKSILTYQGLSQLADRLRETLRQEGVAEGERVAVVLPNGPEFVAMALAIWKAGAIVTPFHTQLHANELSQYLQDCEIGTIVTPNPASGLVFRKAPVSKVGRAFQGNARGDLPALTQYSTGSTGRSKRVSRSHKQLLDEFATLSSILKINSQDRILGAVPFFHSYGFMNAMLCSLLSGAALYAVANFLPRDLARLIENEKLTGFPGVPFLWHQLAELTTPADLSSIRYALAAGAPLAEITARTVLEKYGVTIHQLYGTTETGVISVNLGAEAANAFTSVGRTIPGVSVSIEEGAVAVKSDYATQGYDGETGNTESRFEDGKFYPGDEGVVDAEGRLHLTGRRRAFINVAGNKVDPGEVEALLRKYPAVTDVAVVGIPAGLGVEKVKAVIVLSSPATESEIFDFCRNHVADFKCPRVIEFRAEIPRNPMGKVLRKYLLEES